MSPPISSGTLLLLGGKAGGVIDTAALREAIDSTSGAYRFSVDQIWQVATMGSAFLAGVNLTAGRSVRR